MRKKINRRFLSLFLSGAMVFSLCPPPVDNACSGC